MSEVRIEIYHDQLTDGYQVSITDEKGGGYRLMGPKFSGNSVLVSRSMPLSKRDAKEIGRYLSRVGDPSDAH